MPTFLEYLKQDFKDLVNWFKQRSESVDTMVDETVVPDEPSEADKPEGWIDPADTPDEVTPGGTTPGEHSPGPDPGRGDRAPGEPGNDPEESPGESSPESPSPEESPGETTGEMDVHPLKDLAEVAKEVAAGDWGIGQMRRTNLSNAGYNVKEVEAEVTRQLNNR